MQGADHIEKDGASTQASPAKSTRPAFTGRTGSGQVSDDLHAKLRAVVDAFGGKPCVVRLDDGRTAILSAEALRVVDIPLSHSSASNSEAKRNHA